MLIKIGSYYAEITDEKTINKFKVLSDGFWELTRNIMLNTKAGVEARPYINAEVDKVIEKIFFAFFDLSKVKFYKANSFDEVNKQIEELK